MIPARAPTITVGNKVLGGAQVILPVEVTVGRENPTAQPNANALSFSYLGVLPPQFVRGAPVDCTLLGYEEPGWSDIWDDLWSYEPPTPGLLPEPTVEGFDQWERFWGWGQITEARRNYVTNPAMRDKGAQVTNVRTNIAINPSAEAATGWLSNNGANWTVSDDPTVFHSGTKSRLCVPTQATIDAGSRTIMSLYDVGGVPTAVVPNRHYVASVYLRTNAPQGEGYLGLSWLDANNAVISTSYDPAPYQIMPTGEWTRVWWSAVSPSNAARLRIIATVNRTIEAGGVQPGDGAWADDCLIEFGKEPGTYFDGRTPPQGIYTYVWGGAPDASGTYERVTGVPADWSAYTNIGGAAVALPGEAGVLRIESITGDSYQTGTRNGNPTLDGRKMTLVGGQRVWLRAQMKRDPLPAGIEWYVNMGFLGRSDTDNDSSLLINPGTDIKTSVPADGQWHEVWADYDVKPDRVMECVYVTSQTKDVATMFVPRGYGIEVRNVMVADGPGPYFDGSTPDTAWEDYSWAGAADESESLVSSLSSEAAPVASYEQGGAVLVTDFTPSTIDGDAVWQGQPFSLGQVTDRTVRAYVSASATTAASVKWELLWSATNPTPDYFDPATTAVTSPASPVTGGYCSATLTAPPEAMYGRLSLRVDDRPDMGVVRMTGWNARLGKETPDERTRFRGTITDLSSQTAGAVLQTQVQCIGMLAQFGDRYIGDEPWPVETDAARAQRIHDLIGGDTFVPNGSVQVSLNGRDVDRRKGADVLRDQAGSTGALLWEQPDGAVRYDSSESRGLDEGTPPRLAGAEIIADAEWRQEMSRFIPRILVEYGVDPGEGAERPVYASGDPAYAESKINTDLSDLASATLVGDLIVRRWGDPTIWDAPRVHTTTEILTQGSYEALLATLPGDVIETDMMADSPVVAGVTGRWFVEGWTESWDRPNDGDLVHDLNLSVSDYRRFTLAGEPPGLVLTAPAQWTFDGPLVAVTATMDPTIADGTLTLYCEGRQVGAPTKPVAGKVTWQVKSTAVPVGERTLEAQFSGVFAYWQADTAYAAVVVLPSASVALAFTATPTIVHTGSNVTLAVTGTGPDGRACKGRITWAYSIDGGVTFKDWYTDTLVAGTIRRTWKSNSPQYGWVWRCRYTPDPGQGHAVTTSDGVPVDVQTQVTQSKQYMCTWSVTYDSTGAERVGVAPMVQGRHSSGTYGDQRSLAGFAIPPADWTGWTITKVEVYFYFQKWGQGTGSARIGSHTYDAKPASNPVISPRQWVSKWGVGPRWVDVTGWGKGLATGAMKGLTLGPAGTTSTLYYGEAHGVSQANKPRVRITGSRWV